ncbi:MAG TPA: crotonase/enoyl-CoA hydratase family protein [Acetobacteraceae bacterium]|nr:crotonase/enoyl-CoA hydratase family protein [Acetobacteraceae bacterium]
MTLVRKLPAAAAASLPAASFADPAPAAGFDLDSAPRSYETVNVEVDAARRVFWCRLNPQGRPCFSPQLLSDVTAMHASIEARFRSAGTSAAHAPFRYFVCGSAIPGIYNLGGDLGLFRTLIGAGDLEGLRRYGHTAVEAIHRNHTALNLPMVTIALVQGDALGGGFECALAHDVIIAERSAKFGLPEVLFNLFPGMGAYSFLSRRLGRAAAEKMILSGRIYSADELHDMGLVHTVVPDGEGEQAVNDYVDASSRWHNAHHATFKAGRRVDPVTLEELRDVVDGWAEAALRLSETDLRRMARLAGAQDRRVTPARPPVTMTGAVAAVG